MAFRFAYSTNAYTKWPLERAIEDVRARGFDGVELLADLPHAYPGSCRAADLRRALAGFPVANLNANTSLGLDEDGRDTSGFWPSLVDADAAARRLKIDYVRRVIDLARELGAPSVCTATGRKPYPLSARRAEGLLLDAFDKILDHAAEKPAVRVGIEYEPGFLVGGVAAAQKLIARLDHPLMGVNLDLGHAECEGEDLAETIEALGPRIWNIHLEDIRARVHRHLVPGEGDIDFAKIRRALEKIGYARFITLELYPYKDDPGGAGSRGLAHLKPVFA